MENACSKRRMEKVLGELFECPVCYEIPENEVYQCKNGHSICDSCFKVVNLCPQCRRTLKDKIRNRTMEAFVAGMEVGCRNKGKGCSVIMLRKDLAAHIDDDCEFSLIKSINLCKILYQPYCGFVSRRPDEIYRHFVDRHEATLDTIWHDGTSRSQGGIVKGPLGKSLEFMMTSKENRMTFRAVDVTIEGSFTFKLLICYFTNIKQSEYSVICLYIGQHEVSPYDVTVEILGAEKKVRWTWSGKPIHYMRADNALINPPFKIPIPYLLEALGSECEKLDCEITIF